MIDDFLDDEIPEEKGSSIKTIILDSFDEKIKYLFPESIYPIIIDAELAERVWLFKEEDLYTIYELKMVYEQQLEDDPENGEEQFIQYLRSVIAAKVGNHKKGLLSEHYDTLVFASPYLDTYRKEESTRDFVLGKKKIPVDVKCPRCPSILGYRVFEQTRSGDEAATGFYECFACSHRWKD